MDIILHNNNFRLLPEKALYKPDEGLLIIADVHLGKASHFRNSGIPLSANSQMGDFVNLEILFRKIEPRKVYFLGDLFHSNINRDWHYFSELIAKFPQIQFTLIKGNHDLINPNLFLEIGIPVIDQIETDTLVYSHEPMEGADPNKINIAGHIHPGFVLSGVGRQYIKLACYYRSNNLFLLPAFGMLTGLVSMQRTSSTTIYVILPGEVREI